MSLSALLGEEKLNEHEMAWRSRDWESVKKLADSYKEKASNEFFFILNQINSNKTRINVDDFESYTPFMVNNALSKHIDCVQHAFNMNLLSDNISDQMHFDYLLHSIRPAKRYGGANDINDPIETMLNTVFVSCVGKIYEVSKDRASEYIDILVYKDEIDKIKYLKRTAVPMINEAFVKDACPYAKTPDIKNIISAVKEWVK